MTNLNIQRTPKAWTSKWQWFIGVHKGRNGQAQSLRIALAAKVYNIWRERDARIFRNDVSAD